MLDFFSSFASVRAANVKISKLSKVFYRLEFINLKEAAGRYTNR